MFTLLFLSSLFAHGSELKQVKHFENYFAWFTFKNKQTGKRCVLYENELVESIYKI